MKIPLLILCLAVVYGTCQTYDADDVTKAIQNNGDYKNYANMPFERSLARYKRTISSVIPPDSLLSLLGIIGSTNENFILQTFINKLLTGNGVWSTLSTISKFCLANISKLLDPFMQIIQPVVDLISKIIDISSDRIFQLAKDFFLKMFLPGLHIVLNKVLEANSKIKILPNQIVTLIEMFNTLYATLKFFGQVP